jgi:hypothetical protein
VFPVADLGDLLVKRFLDSDGGGDDTDQFLLFGSRIEVCRKYCTYGPQPLAFKVHDLPKIGFEAEFPYARVGFGICGFIQISEQDKVVTSLLKNIGANVSISDITAFKVRGGVPAGDRMEDAVVQFVV